ncbi:dihydrodipicolinate synthase family protein [Altererythrobacter sp. Root672]|uniref:dihydrodipicolinate synthase family protein n=1 Tax=Altererythrobacter sp. Root672 TaxID=1736584 RepID=UPI00070083C1|nr:dihydrodipicolinate synthase family protein [Altererythrobacter sp. Root672]KRA84493.1 hypothetical protein ASD76_11110 [Altererythrobacter sp. Root672]
MSNLNPAAMAQQLGKGLLSFPVTHFDDGGRFAEGAYRAHCASMLEQELAGLFAAGGTGEFFSLAPDEVISVTSAAVEVAKGRVPVVLSGAVVGARVQASNGDRLALG